MKNKNLFLYGLLLLLFLGCEDDPVQYQLTTRVDPEGSGTISPVSAIYNKGTEVEITAQANAEYLFKNWTDDASGNVNPMKIVMTDDKVITAVFEKVQYALQIEVVGEGTVTQEVLQAKSTTDYPSGTAVQLTAIPEDEWEFVKWEGDHTGTENPMTVTVTEPVSITAVFQKVNYSLTVETVGQGSVLEEIVQAKSTTDYPSGTSVQLTAMPEEDWQFVAWSGDHEGDENPLVLSMTAPMNLTATFELINLEQVYVPDDNFELALMFIGLDDKLDDYVYAARIKNVRELRLAGRQINDLTGIEGFENLMTLIVTNNNLKSLDISNNFRLQSLICDRNQLQSLDISNNLLLNSMVANENELSCIRVSQQQMFAINIQGPGAKWFSVDEGVTYSVDCGIGNAGRTYIPDTHFEQALIGLGLDDVLDDHVRTMNIISLEELDISGLGISDLTGLEDFKSLRYLDCSNNNISTLDPFLGSSFGYGFELGTLILNNNNISSIDISKLHCLIMLDIRENPVTCVQVSENHLMCMEPNALIRMQVRADEGVSFSLDCGN